MLVAPDTEPVFVMFPLLIFKPPLIDAPLPTVNAPPNDPAPSTLKLAALVPSLLTIASVVAAEASKRSIVYVPAALRLSVVSFAAMLVTLLAESSVKSDVPPLLNVTAPGPLNPLALTEVKEGVVEIAIAPQIPPDPSVIVLPPPLRFPVPV